MTLLELVEQEVSLRQYGKEWKGLCPFHAEKTPSFSVNAEKGLYYCHSCRAGGDAITWLRQKRGLSFRDAARAVGKELSVIDRDSERRKRQAREAVLHRFYTWKHEQRRQLDVIGEELFIAEMAYRSIVRAPQTWPEDEQTYWITRLDDLYQKVDKVVYETDVIVNDPATAWQWWREDSSS